MLDPGYGIFDAVVSDDAAVTFIYSCADLKEPTQILRINETKTPKLLWKSDNNSDYEMSIKDNSLIMLNGNRILFRYNKKILEIID